MGGSDGSPYEGISVFMVSRSFVRAYRARVSLRLKRQKGGYKLSFPVGLSFSASETLVVGAPKIYINTHGKI